MCKLFLISLILTSSLFFSFLINNCNSEEKNYVYELQLSENDPDVVKFVENGWNKLCAEDSDKATTERGNYYIVCGKPELIEFAEYGLRKLAAERRIMRGRIIQEGMARVTCARVQVIGTERRYT
ncbi:Protein of unknown function, partial [Cotesia congregata]